MVFSEASSFEGKTADKDARLWAENREVEVKKLLDSGRSLEPLSVAEGMLGYIK